MGKLIFHCFLLVRILFPARNHGLGKRKPGDWEIKAGLGYTEQRTGEKMESMLNMY